MKEENEKGWWSTSTSSDDAYDRHPVPHLRTLVFLQYAFRVGSPTDEVFPSMSGV